MTGPQSNKEMILIIEKERTKNNDQNIPNKLNLT